jgi:hypothetical protein
MRVSLPKYRETSLLIYQHLGIVGFLQIEELCNVKINLEY